jgi:hypothetical protein
VDVNRAAPQSHRIRKLPVFQNIFERQHMATAMALGEAAGTMAAIAAEEGASMAGLDPKVVRDRLRAQSAATSVEDCHRLMDSEPNTMMRAQASSRLIIKTGVNASDFDLESVGACRG